MESTKNEEWRLLENDLLAEIDSLTSSMNEREELLADLELEIQNSIEALKVPHLPYWHYLDGIGWLWTAPQFHPYVYSFERDNWLFYNQGSHNLAIFRLPIADLGRLVSRIIFLAPYLV